MERIGRVAAVRPRIGQRPEDGEEVAGVLGQPWVRISGVASGSGERTCRKCTFCPSISVVNCGTWFSRASCARQSYPVRQYSARSLR